MYVKLLTFNFSEPENGRPIAFLPIANAKTGSNV
jgi:hypothetical protein